MSSPSCCGTIDGGIAVSFVLRRVRLLGTTDDEHELAERVCRVFGRPHYEHLSIPKEVA